ncbi:YdeA protein [Klebsiella pneumoniae IS22]|nr:YdeA protein [Klebsiella pneumoniae IS22]
MMREKARRPSPLQRRVLIVLAALDEKRPGPVLTRDIERGLERSGEAPVYGPNLRASCRRLEDAGWLRTLRAPNLQLAVELTDAGRAVAQPLLPAGGTSATDLAVELNGITYQACRGDFVVRLDGSTCLQLWNKEGRVVRREGDPLEVAQWLQACHDAGMEVRVQINESAAP